MAEEEQKQQEQQEQQQPKDEEAPAKEEKSAQQEKPSEKAKSGGNDGPFLAPYGNSAGDKIQSTLSTVGNPVGKGLETVTKPVGGVVDAVVGGVMRSGGAFGEVAGVGGGTAEQKKGAETLDGKPLGGEEQTGENPLGLKG